MFALLRRIVRSPLSAATVSPVSYGASVNEPAPRYDEIFTSGTRRSDREILTRVLDQL